ncbi:hypothetical protein EXIGLDRAFT_587760, partial [Exidia glandulosa HHB12029]
IRTSLPPGATGVPITVFGDKTQLTQYVGVGGNTAYPFYMTLSTIDGYVQRDVSNDVHVMFALLPIIDLRTAGFSKAVQRRLNSALVHKALRLVFASLRDAARSGMDLPDVSGNVYDGYPTLAVVGLDYPEQC